MLLQPLHCYKLNLILLINFIKLMGINNLQFLMYQNLYLYRFQFKLDSWVPLYISNMIEKKSFIMALKRAFETGTFNYVGQEVQNFPEQLWNVDQLNIEDQNWWECNPITKIDVSNNQIAEIPEGILALPDIQLLRMKNNLVKEFPSHLLAFENLKSVDLNRNRLEVISPSISKSRTLVELNFAQNMLEYCPDLHEIASLQVIYLNNNRLKSLPCLGEGVKRAEFQQNRLTQIKRQHFQRCHNLEQLNFNKNHIEAVERNSFANLKNLVLLQMKENRLLSLSELPNSEKLDTINLGFNRLTEFSYFDRCPNLTVLILSDNKIKSLSNDIIKLKKLKTLDISNNDLSELPCQIGFINSLVRIQVEGNPLKTMRQNIRTGGTNIIKNYLKDRMDPKQKEKIESRMASTFEKVSDSEYWSKLIYEFSQNGELILRKMNLTSIDESVYEKNLRGINFSDNKIKELSESIRNLGELKYIIVNNNEIQMLPMGLGRISELQQIQAKNNKVEDFRAGPGDYPSLHMLDLSANRINFIPKGILMLPKLRTLYLGYNHISDAQPLWNPKILTNIEVIDLSNNQLSELSDNVYLRAGLNYLNIQNNNLSRIPTLLGFMKLSGLKIDGNPLKLIKRTVIDKGTVAILDYLRTKHVGPVPEPQPEKQQPREPEFVSEAPTYPYETEKIQVPREQPKQQKSVQNIKQKERRIGELQKEIKKIQDQLDNNMGMNNMQKNQKKKAMQQMMIQRNKIIKEIQG